MQAWLDKQVGAEKLHLAKLLQQHGVIVRGGQEQGQKLMDALLVRPPRHVSVDMTMLQDCSHS